MYMLERKRLKIRSFRASEFLQDVEELTFLIIKTTMILQIQILLSIIINGK